jgi:exosortase/archaeosortase family protein
MPVVSGTPESSPVGWKRSIAAHAIGIGVFVLLQVLGERSPESLLRFFCSPAARLASLWLGSPCLDTPEGPLIAHPQIDVRVAMSCSGYEFFALLAAVVAGITVYRAGVRWGIFWWFLPVYPVALLANAARIVCCVYAQLYASLLPGPIPGATVHLVTGVIIFVTTLLLSSLAVHHLHDQRFSPHASAPAGSV